MPHIYHPNKNITGFACSFSNSERDNVVFATLVKQSGWDAQSQNGTFKASLDDPTRHVNIKLSDTEISAICDCIERNRPFSSFHDNDKNPKGIKFEPWLSKPTDGSAPVVKGYSFSIVVGDKQDTTYKNPFYIGLTFPEARLIREYLLFSLQRHFYNDSYKQEPSPVKQTNPNPNPEVI